jgi:hypothetical protein
MDKSEQIYKILNYITNHRQLNIRKMSDGIFDVGDTIINVDDKEYNMRSYHGVFVDFNKKEIHWSAWEESGHNGSSYDNKYGTVDWDFLERYYPAFEKLALSYFKEEVLIDEEKRKQQLLQLAAEEKLNQLIGE